MAKKTNKQTKGLYAEGMVSLYQADTPRPFTCYQGPLKGTVSPRYAIWKSNEVVGINWESTNSCLTLLKVV